MGSSGARFRALPVNSLRKYIVSHLLKGTLLRRAKGPTSYGQGQRELNEG